MPVTPECLYRMVCEFGQLAYFMAGECWKAFGPLFVACYHGKKKKRKHHNQITGTL